MLLEENTLPNHNYEAKKILFPMGMEYKRTHEYPHDCIYRKGVLIVEKLSEVWVITLQLETKR